MIYSWTPKQYLNRIKGARLRLIDENERAITTAILSGSVARSQSKVSVKSVYNAEKLRKEVREGTVKKKKSLEHFNKAVDAINNFEFKFAPKTEKEGEA